jgi:hypothetical protein
MTRREEAFSGGLIALGRGQKLDRLAGGIQRSIQILVLAFDFNVRLVDPIAFVRALQMRTAPAIQLRA